MTNNKNPKVFKKRQTVWFNHQGILLKTDELFLKLLPYVGKNIISLLPFMESIYPEIIRTLKINNSIHFAGVHISKSPILKSNSDQVFDFYFFMNSQSHVKWEIFDLSSYYKNLQNTQHFFQVQELNSQKNKKT